MAGTGLSVGLSCRSAQMWLATFSLVARKLDLWTKIGFDPQLPYLLYIQVKLSTKYAHIMPPRGSELCANRSVHWQPHCTVRRGEKQIWRYCLHLPADLKEISLKVDNVAEKSFERSRIFRKSAHRKPYVLFTSGRKWICGYSVVI